MKRTVELYLMHLIYLVQRVRNDNNTPRCKPPPDPSHRVLKDLVLEVGKHPPDHDEVVPRLRVRQQVDVLPIAVVQVHLVPQTSWDPLYTVVQLLLADVDTVETATVGEDLGQADGEITPSAAQVEDSADGSGTARVQHAGEGQLLVEIAEFGFCHGPGGGPGREFFFGKETKVEA